MPLNSQNLCEIAEIVLATFIFYFVLVSPLEGTENVVNLNFFKYWYKWKKTSDSHSFLASFVIYYNVGKQKWNLFFFCFITKSVQLLPIRSFSPWNERIIEKFCCFFWTCFFFGSKKEVCSTNARRAGLCQRVKRVLFVWRRKRKDSLWFKCY